MRTGDFITNLIHQAHNVNDLAFALGALSHFVGDTMGHLDAVNPAVAVEFPDLAENTARLSPTRNRPTPTSAPSSRSTSIS